MENKLKGLMKSIAIGTGTTGVGVAETKIRADQWRTATSNQESEGWISSCQRQVIDSKQQQAYLSLHQLIAGGRRHRIKPSTRCLYLPDQAHLSLRLTVPRQSSIAFSATPALTLQGQPHRRQKTLGHR